MSTIVTVLTVISVLELAVISYMMGSEKLNPEITYQSNIRLPYKKFQEIYPDNRIMYPQYKEMQTRQAFKVSIPSKKLKRMVR
ncbi:MAG: hypothetical protein ACWGQW_17140 [bacterium]